MYELVKIHLRCGMSESCNQSCHCLTLLIHDYLRQAYKATVVKCDQHELQPYTHLFHNFLTSRVKKSTCSSPFTTIPSYSPFYNHNIVFETFPNV